MFITLKRISKSGLKTFLRNGFLSLSSILVITITLIVVFLIYFSTVLLESSVEQLEKKVDVNIYFKQDAPVEKILEFKKLIEDLPQIDKEKTNYKSKDEVLENFKSRHKGEPIVLEGLDIIGDNPFGAIINISAKEISYYSEISEFIESEEMFKKFGDIVGTLNYRENSLAIEKLNKIIEYTYKIGFIVSITLILISLIITFNTMRLIIYTFKEEISIMRLVGASRFFARGPFLIEGILYGFISSIFSLFIFWSIIYSISSKLEPIFLVNLNQFFSTHILEITGSIMAMGIFIGFLSTYLAVSKYLKV